MKIYTCSDCAFSTDDYDTIMTNHFEKGHEISQIESEVEE